MEKRERLQRTIAGDQTDRPPVALWRHFPGDDQRAADLARSTLEFQSVFDWDFTVVVPASSFSVIDYGATDDWNGAPDGTRTIIRRPIERSLDWTALRTLDPQRGAYGRQLEATRLITEALGETTPVIHLIYNPFYQAHALAGSSQLMRHLRTAADRVHTGLNVLTESTLRFIEALRRLPIAGILYIAFGASYEFMPEEEYRAHVLPYDRKIIESLPTRWWLNILSFPQPAPMFRLVSELRTMVVHWRDQDGEPDLGTGRLMTGGAVCGGIAIEDHLVRGTPTTIRDAVRAALVKTNHRRLIVSASGPVPLTAPLSNLRALRAGVEGG